MGYFVTIPIQNIAWDSGVSGATALVFYKNGVITRVYTVGDLVRIPFLVERSISMAWWLNRDSIEFDAETNRLTLTTSERITYVFDITTGEIISRRHSTRNILFIFAVGVAIVAGVSLLGRRIYKKQRRKI